MPTYNFKTDNPEALSEMQGFCERNAVMSQTTKDTGAYNVAFQGESRLAQAVADAFPRQTVTNTKTQTVVTPSRDVVPII
jgi:hypothetical protein